ncbi:uncharacterized protein BJ212DRAFT_1299659 [Suillus subaureus]|uniref:Uncharacterized protein n=1 Tax=Suillus subaureus TaxID=48587 RepID=A0A9P7JDK6_9AGAM|nr:uncharacterized protein BJ212DRAFT_1299659 [Suillus subaureus]KAG1816372.1 hypothetical protein BJ212DRAFT_1299659 [Suillus subaureus]
MERAGIAQGYLSSGLNFLHKIEIVNGVETTHFLEAKYLMNMIVDVIWQEGLYPDINLENLDCVFGLAGAAVHNAIKAYHEVLIRQIHLDDALREYSQTAPQRLVSGFWIC